jgi:effector-binding domain-containing protein
MIDEPWIDELVKQEVAFVPICVPRHQIQEVMRVGLNEIVSVLKEQGIETVGPWMTHHHYLNLDEFNCDICVPVARPVTPQGRVRPGILPSRKVARAVHRGPYNELAQAWRALMNWAAVERLHTCIDFFECYVKGPESSADPAQWETMLSVPLMD